MSDHTDVLEKYISRNIESLAAGFIDRYRKNFDEYCNERYFNESEGDQLGISEDAL